MREFGQRFSWGGGRVGSISRTIVKVDRVTGTHSEREGMGLDTRQRKLFISNAHTFAAAQHAKLTTGTQNYARIGADQGLHGTPGLTAQQCKNSQPLTRIPQADTDHPALS